MSIFCVKCDDGSLEYDGDGVWKCDNCGAYYTDDEVDDLAENEDQIDHGYNEDEDDDVRRWRWEHEAGIWDDDPENDPYLIFLAEIDDNPYDGLEYYDALKETYAEEIKAIRKKKGLLSFFSKLSRK